MSDQATRYLSIDIGGTFVKHALMDAGGGILSQGKVSADTSGEQGLAATMRAVRDAVGELWDTHSWTSYARPEIVTWR